ncbi:MAG: hypothetical protein AB1742_09170 [bacterium]
MAAGVVSVCVLLGFRPGAAQEGGGAGEGIAVDVGRKVVLRKDAPLGVFVFTSLRFKRGEMSRYFSEATGGYFSKERETLLRAMRGLLHLSLVHDSSLQTIAPDNYERLFPSMEIEAYDASLREEPEKKFDTAALRKYAELLKLEYLLVGDLLRMEEWEIPGEDSRGCRVEIAYFVYDAGRGEMVLRERFDVSDEVPDAGPPSESLPPKMDENVFMFGRSAAGYCFLKSGGQLLEKIEAG